VPFTGGKWHAFPQAGKSGISNQLQACGMAKPDSLSDTFQPVRMGFPIQAQKGMPCF